MRATFTTSAGANIFFDVTTEKRNDGLSGPPLQTYYEIPDEQRILPIRHTLLLLGVDEDLAYYKLVR